MWSDATSAHCASSIASTTGGGPSRVERVYCRLVHEALSVLGGRPGAGLGADRVSELGAVVAERGGELQPRPQRRRDVALHAARPHHANLVGSVPERDFDQPRLAGTGRTRHRDRPADSLAQIGDRGAQHEQLALAAEYGFGVVGSARVAAGGCSGGVVIGADARRADSHRAPTIVRAPDVRGIEVRDRVRCRAPRPRRCGRVGTCATRRPDGRTDTARRSAGSTAVHATARARPPLRGPRRPLGCGPRRAARRSGLRPRSCVSPPAESRRPRPTTKRRSRPAPDPATVRARRRTLRSPARDQLAVRALASATRRSKHTASMSSGSTRSR